MDIGKLIKLASRRPTKRIRYFVNRFANTMYLIQLNNDGNHFFMVKDIGEQRAKDQEFFTYAEPGNWKSGSLTKVVFDNGRFDYMVPMTRWMEVDK